MSGLEHKPPPLWSAIFGFPHRTRAGLNAREHWRTRHRQTRRDRDAIYAAWITAGRPKPPAFPARVVFTRIAPRQLDAGDNLPSAFKAMRDELALVFGLRGDGGGEVSWEYRQEKPKTPRFYGVRVEISCALPEVLR